MRKTNQAGINLIKTFEGCRLTAYKDVGGLWTIGYGHTPAEPGQNITQDQADSILLSDLDRFELGIISQVVAPLNDNQFSALVAFAFNVGLGNFRDSTLRHKVNEKDYKGAANWFLPWCKVHGVEVEGLLNRREAERRLFLTPV